ncbi:hypothetical protein PR048_023909 [Dryococelus australis]|uniref:Uncharacterized protein n=1 Tax=Dryococelus australis TaxID=614101 RepID=A0ABQ9GVC4_9NEOP|nr:hypothetical protein PR048_023909 [Dryococelus australis]
MRTFSRVTAAPARWEMTTPLPYHTTKTKSRKSSSPVIQGRLDCGYAWERAVRNVVTPKTLRIYPVGGILVHLRANHLRLLGRKIMQGDMHRGKEGLGSHGLLFGGMTTSLSVLRASLNYEEQGKNRPERRKNPCDREGFQKWPFCRGQRIVSNIHKLDNISYRSCKTIRRVRQGTVQMSRDVQGVLTSGLCVLCCLVRETSSARREIQLLQPYGWYKGPHKGPSTPPALSFGNDERVQMRRLGRSEHVVQQVTQQDVYNESLDCSLLSGRNTSSFPRFLLRASRMYSSEQAPAYLASLHRTPLLSFKLIRYLADLPWRSQLVRRWSAVREVLGSSPVGKAWFVRIIDTKNCAEDYAQLDFPRQKLPFVYSSIIQYVIGATVAERLACSPPT